MTQVKSIAFATSNNGETEHVKVTYKNDRGICLNADEAGGSDQVLSDLKNGDFDYFYAEALAFDAFDTEAQVADWDAKHPDAKVIFGE